MYVCWILGFLIRFGSYICPANKKSSKLASIPVYTASCKCALINRYHGTWSSLPIDQPPPRGSLVQPTPVKTQRPMN